MFELLLVNLYTKHSQSESKLKLVTTIGVVSENQMGNDEIMDPPFNCNQEIEPIKDRNVSFVDLFRFSSKKDGLMIIVGIISSILSGIFWPIALMYYANITDSMIKYSHIGKEVNDCNAS